MASTTLCDKLLHKIAEKFTLQAEWQDRVGLPQSPETTDKLKYLSKEIDDLVDRLLYAPLCLLPLSANDRPEGIYLRVAADVLNDLAAPSDKPPFLAGAQTAIERASEALKLDINAGAMNKGLVLLFDASLLAKQEKYADAIERVKLALPYFPRQGAPYYMMVANLLLGNFYYYSGQPSQASFEGLIAYSLAFRHLGHMMESEAQYGRKYQAEMYRLLKEKIFQRNLNRRLPTIVRHHPNEITIVGRPGPDSD